MYHPIDNRYKISCLICQATSLTIYALNVFSDR